MQLVEWFNSIFMKNYDEDNDFVLFKKAQFLTSLSMALGLFMIILILGSLITSPEVFARSFRLAGILVVLLAVVIYLTVSGRVIWAANFLAVATLLMEMAGLVLRPPHLAGVTLGYFFLSDSCIRHPVLQFLYISFCVSLYCCNACILFLRHFL